jgi:hypothetical protein
MGSGASSTNSERDERVFIAAFGIMDSHQDGEAVAAFMRVREILRRHGGGFRRILERSHEAERLNQELGKQNEQLLRENTALRARDSRPLSSPPAGARRPFVTPAVPGFKHWDIGLIGVIAISTAYGLLGVAAAFALTAAILICAAFTNWFSPIRFLVGILLGLAALGMGASNRADSVAAPTLAIADAPASAVATTPAYALADAAPQSQGAANATVLAMPATVATADARLQRQMLAYAPSPRPHSSADLPPRPASVEPRTQHGTAAKIHCGPYRLQPGFTCPRSNLWRRNFFPDFGRPLSMRYD